jgi:hypothetical protein
MGRNCTEDVDPHDLNWFEVLRLGERKTARKPTNVAALVVASWLLIDSGME